MDSKPHGTFKEVVTNLSPVLPRLVKTYHIAVYHMISITVCELRIQFITCSAVILYADWSIGGRPGAVHTLEFQYLTVEFNITS